MDALDPYATVLAVLSVSLLLIASKSLVPAQMDLNACYTRRSGDGSVVPTDATVWTASFGGPAR